ncbi:MAG: hypothetical protein WCA97_10225 [Terriglobales bacterium]
MKGTILLLLVLSGGLQLSAQTVVQQFAAVSSGAGVVSDMDLPDPTAEGSVLIAMPELLTPDVKVLSVTDNAPAGGNTYKQVSGAVSSCAKAPIDIWYCERCNPGVTELKFHLSGHVRASINSFLEVSNLALPAALDGSGAQISDGKVTSSGLEVGPSIKTTATDFVIAAYSSINPRPTGVTPVAWTFKPTYVYQLNAAPGTYQPTLTGSKAGGNFCTSIAAFKTKPAPVAH